MPKDFMNKTPKNLERVINVKLKGSTRLAEILETIVISVTVLSLLPVAYWLNAKELTAHLSYFYYLFVMLCLMGYITYRRIKRLRMAMRSPKEQHGIANFIRLCTIVHKVYFWNSPENAMYVT
jgi:uncharacterized membrane protein